MKSMIWWLVIALSHLSTHFCFSQDTSPMSLTLDAAVEMALKNNENILIANNEVRTASAQIREAWAEALPDIRFSGIYTRNIKQPVFFFPDPMTGEQRAFRIGSTNSYVLNLSVEQPLFQAGKVSGGIKAAQLFRQFSKEGLQATRATVVLAVKKAYYLVQLNEQLLAINEQSLNQQLANLHNTRLLFKEGQVSELDTLSAWVDYSNLHPAVFRAENDLAIAKNELKDLIGLNLDQDITLSGVLDFEQTNGISVDDLEEEALQGRPELKQLEYQTGILQQNIGVTRADLLPKLYFSGLYQSVAQSDAFNLGQGFQTSISGAIRLEIPIFSGLRNVARLQQAHLDLRNSRYELQLFKDNLRIEIKSVLSRVKEAEKRVWVQQQTINQAERAYFIAERRYKEGAGTQLELGDALLALNQTKTNYVQAVYDHKVALAELYKAIGRQ